MRPIERYKINDVVTLDDGTQVTVNEDFKPSRDAINILLSNFGPYCSYCEACVSNGLCLQVEHIFPKGLNPDLKFKWSNFLLGCSICNGSGGKGATQMPVASMHLPDKNNTFKSLVYLEGGVVKVNPSLNEEARKNAQALIDYLRLNKSPKSSFDERDGRTQMRREIWEIATDWLNDYKPNNPDNLKKLIQYAKARGGWSIWFTVFKNHDEVRKALISEFPGTAAHCFDPDNHYEPIDRHPGLADPT